MSEITNPKTAKVVLATAKENSVWEAPIPTDEDDLLKQANHVYRQAVKAWDGGIRGKAVTAVKTAGDALEEPDPLGATPEEKEESEIEGILMQTVPQVKLEIDQLALASEIDLLDELLIAEKKWKKRAGVIKYIDEALKDAYKEPDESGEIESGDRGESQGSGSVSPWSSLSEEEKGYPAEPKSKFKKAFEAEEFARAQARKMNLPVPEKVDDIPIATLSRNVANLTVTELAERLTDASLCLAAATWQTALAEIDEEHAERVGNHYFNIEYAKAAPDAKNVQAATAKAEEVEEVKNWREAEAEAHSRYLSFRALKEVYKGTYDTISRVFAMKQEENGRPR